MTVLHPRAKTRAIFSPRSSLPGNPYSAMPSSPQTAGASGIKEVSGSFRTRLNAISAGGWAWTMALMSGLPRYVC